MIALVVLVAKGYPVSVEGLAFAPVVVVGYISLLVSSEFWPEFSVVVVLILVVLEKVSVPLVKKEFTDIPVLFVFCSSMLVSIVVLALLVVAAD